MSRGFVILKITESNFESGNTCFSNSDPFQRTNFRESTLPTQAQYFARQNLQKFSGY